MKRILVIAVLASALGTMKMAANPKVRRPIQHFIQFYRQQDDMGFVPRALYSWMLAQRAD